MADQIHERCFTCGHYAGDGQCKRTFAVHMMLMDGHGSIKIEVLPGTVPEHLEAKFQQRLQEIVSRFMEPVFLRIPEWAEISDWQHANWAEREECPARSARKDMGAFLHCIRGGL